MESFLILEFRSSLHDAKTFQDFWFISIPVNHTINLRFVSDGFLPPQIPPIPENKEVAKCHPDMFLD